MENLERRIEKFEEIKSGGFLQSFFRKIRPSILPVVAGVSMFLSGCGGKDKVVGTGGGSQGGIEEPEVKKNQSPDTFANIVEPEPVFVGGQRITIYDGNGRDIYVGYAGSDEDGRVVNYQVSVEGLNRNIDWFDLMRDTGNTVEDIVYLFEKSKIKDLPPGDYKLKIRAVDNEGLEDSSPAVVDFSVGVKGNRVVFPENSPYEGLRFEVVGSNSTVETRGDGGFDFDLSDIVGSEVVVLKHKDKALLLGYVLEGDEGIELNAESSIVALAMMNPIFINAPLEVKREISRELRRDLDFRSFVKNVDFQLQLRLPEGYSDIFPLKGKDLYHLIDEYLEKFLEEKASKLVVDKNGPYLEDIVGSNIKLVNTENVCYSSLISTLPSLTRKDLFLLSPKKGFVDFNLFPPSIIAQPTERIYVLGDGDFEIILHKGFAEFSNFDYDHAAGRATIANVFLGVNNILSLVSGAYGSDDLAALQLAVERVGGGNMGNLEGIESFIENVRNKNVKGSVFDIAEIIYKNRDIIGEIAAVNAKKSAFTVISHIASVVPVIQNVALGMRIGSALDKLPFFYDLAFAPGFVFYEISQRNGVVGDYVSKNHAPDKAFNPSPGNGAVNVPLEVLLDWEGSDPDKDPLKYAIYFEPNDSSPDELLRSGISVSEVKIKNLENNVTYYWRVDVWDGNVTTKGDVWDFTTEGKKIEPLYGRIAFVSDREGNKEIYLIDRDGSQRNLTNNPANEFRPVWSPDGNRILFFSNSGGDDEIYVMDSDGRNQTRLTSNVDTGSSPRWSTDGRRILFAGDAGRWNIGIFVMDSDGSNQRNLTDSNGNYFEGDPDWSPDGSQIVFFHNDISTTRKTNSEIYIMESDGKNQRNLTNNPGNEYMPLWSPDGRRILFLSNRDGNGELYVMDADGKNQRNLSNNPGKDIPYMWSPDGNMILFSSDRDGNKEVYVMNRDGSNQRNLSNNLGEDYPGTWSPDGTRIVFYSDRDGNNEAYVMDADGSNQRNLSNNAGNDYSPVWSPK